MLNTYGYRPDSGFVGIPKQIVDALKEDTEVLKDAIASGASGGTADLDSLNETLKQNGESLNKALTDDIVNAIRNEIINSGSF